MKNKLLHEHSMAEYLYEKRSVGEFLDDTMDALEQKNPFTSWDRKESKALEDRNDQLIRALRNSNTVWGDILRSGDKDNPWGITDIFEKWKISHEEDDFWLKTAMALVAMNERDLGEAIDTVRDWFVDLTGGGHSVVSRGIAIMAAVAGGAVGGMFGKGLAVLGILGVGLSMLKGEEKDILNYIRNTLNDPDLADCLEKGGKTADGKVINATPSQTIQKMFWEYEEYFLTIITNTPAPSLDPSSLLTFDEWYKENYTGTYQCKAEDKEKQTATEKRLGAEAEARKGKVYTAEDMPEPMDWERERYRNA